MKTKNENEERNIFEENGIETDENGWPLKSCGFVEEISSVDLEIEFRNEYELKIIPDIDVSPFQGSFFVSERVMKVIYELLCDAEKAPYCPTCSKMDGHTNVCELAGTKEILKRTVGDRIRGFSCLS